MPPLTAAPRTLPVPDASVGRTRACGPGWTSLAFGVAAALVFVLVPQPVPSLILICGVAVAALAFEWEALVCVMLVVAFFVGHFKIARGGWVVYVIQDVVAVIVILRWAAVQLRSGRPLFGRTPVSGPFLILLGYLLLEFLNPYTPLPRSVLGFRSWVMYTTLLFIGYSAYRDIDRVERIQRVLIWLGIATALYGIWQWQRGPAGLSGFGDRYVRYASRLYWSVFEGPAVFRAFSTFVTPSAFASNMALIITLAFGSTLSRRSSAAWKATCIVGIILMGAGIAVSGSRTGPAYLMSSLVVMLLLLRRYKIVVPMLIGGALSLRLIQALSGTALVPRFATLFDAETFFWKWGRPFFGSASELLSYPLGYGLGFTVGLPQFVTPDSWIQELRTGRVVDSGYGAVIVELGLPGLLLYIWFVIQLAASAWQAWRNASQDERDALIGPAAWAISLPIMSVLTPPQAFLPAASYQWLLIGMLLGAGHRDAPARGAVPLPSRAIASRRRPVASPPLAPAAARR